MFKRLDEEAEQTFTFTFEGKEIRCLENENLAAALLAAGEKTLRISPVSGAPRAPFCMMGACFECLVEIDGKSIQACMVNAHQDMHVTLLPKPASLPEDADNG